MCKRPFLLLLICFSFVCFSEVGFADDNLDEEETVTDTIKEEYSTLHTVLCYIPNRLVDLLDIFRIRAKVGPGAAVGARVSKYGAVYLGSQISVYAGLPGPRVDKLFRSPVGIESYNGAVLSVLDATANAGFDPDYSDTEIGANLHLLFFGLDLSVDPVEIADFFTGFVLVDLREDTF